MNVLLIDQLRPGFLMARDLVDAKGRILLARGVALTQGYIDTLREKGYSRLYIKQEDQPDVDPEEDISVIVRSRAIETLRETFDSIEQELASLRAQSHEELLKAINSENIRALVNQKALLEKVSRIASDLMDDVLTRRTLAGLTSLKSRDGALYDHSLDVCAVAIMIASAINLPTARMRQLAGGCLLHDIGMLFIPRDDDELGRIRHHTILGYELLKATDESEILAPYVAYEHHEHQDGSGLPRGLKGSNQIQRPRGQTTPMLTLIGEIAALANHYDNLLSGTPQQPPLPPDQAIEDISRLTGSFFNRDVVMAMRRVTPVYPKGTQVLVRGAPYDRFSGVVSRVNPEQLDRPWIVLIRDAAGNRVAPDEIDSREYPKLSLRTIGF
ncbi:MAG: HD domain-containing protein [Candidatus Hydrogenedentes bacterium]|nr:HD domain-containing protein [Candidatus Hydrogenedentota bacterium]